MTEADANIAALRAFNRIYTARLGFLHQRLDDSPFSLSEARLLYELAHRPGTTAGEIGRALGMDRAQISRTLQRFTRRGLVKTIGAAGRGHRRPLSLTAAGRAAFAALDDNTQAAIAGLLDGLAPMRRHRLLAAAGTITRLFETEAPPKVAIRGLRPGDLGMVTARQAMIYAEEYGWGQDFEALVARLLADFHQAYDPTRDAAWIAEIDGALAGSVFLVHGDDPETARLRLLYVEPEARGTGLGGLLVGACIARARALGYRRLELWTNSVLVAAQRLYIRAGFALVAEAPHRLFGRDLIGQTWALVL